MASRARPPEGRSRDPAATETPVVETKADFEVVDVLKGPKTLEPKAKITVLYFGQEPVGQMRPEKTSATRDHRNLLRTRSHAPVFLIRRASVSENEVRFNAPH